MKKIYDVFLKVFATYLFIKFISNFFGTISSFFIINEQSLQQIYLAQSLINSGLYLLFSFLLWNNSGKIINFYTSNNVEDDENFIGQINYEKLKQISFSIIGIIFLTLHLPRFIKKLIETFIIRDIPYNIGKQYIANYISPLIESFIIVIISIILIFGYRKLFLKIKKMFGNLENN